MKPIIQHKTSHFIAGLFIFSLFFGLAHAQQKQESKNIIKEIKLVKTDNFKYLKNLLIDTIDFADIQTTVGNHHSILQFEIMTDGKINNVMAKGDCKEMDRKLVKALESLLYKFDMSKMDKDAKETIYEIPIELYVER